MSQRKGRILSTWHEEAYHGASRCQAASLSLTARRLHGLKQVCQVDRQKTGGCFASLGSSLGMCSSGSFKEGGLIALFFDPHGVDHPDPHIRQGAHCDRVAFPLLALASIILRGPSLGVSRLPGKLL